MKLFFLSDGSLIHYSGSLDHDRVVVVAGRDAFFRETDSMQYCLDFFLQSGYTVILYDSPGCRSTMFLLDRKGELRAYPSCIRRMVLIFRAFRYFRFLKWILKSFWVKNYPFSDRADWFKSFLLSLGDRRELILFSRSAGCVLCAHVANQVKEVDGVIAVGYPFCFPNSEPELYRTEALADMAKPFLIIQGEEDPYGGRSVLTRYPLSKFISFKFIKTDHDFALTASQKEELALTMREFISKTCVVNEAADR